MPHPPQIPLTPQTDERNFPRWAKDAPPGKSGHPYPKMLTRTCTKEDRIEWREKNRRVDQHTRQEYYEGVAPPLHSQIPVLSTIEMVDEGLAPLANEPVIVKDSAEEQRIMEFLGWAEPDEPPPTVAIPISAGRLPARYEKAPSSRESLKKAIAEAPDVFEETVKKKMRSLTDYQEPEWIDEPPTKRKGRPPGSKNKKPVTDVGN